MANDNWLDTTTLRVTADDGSTFQCEIKSPDATGLPEMRAPEPFLAARDLDDLFWGVSAHNK